MKQIYPGNLSRGIGKYKYDTTSKITLGPCRRQFSRTAVIIFILLTFASSSFANPYRLRPDWNEYKSDHFIIDYHPNIPNKYIREFTRKCERYYHLIAERLGFKRFDFWLWENRARILIYDSRQEYVKDRGRPEWSAASVHMKKRFISTFYFAEDFFDTILPHELAHIVLREFIGAKSRVPLWFEEGVACANEDGGYLKYLLLAKGFLDKEVNLSVGEMEKMGRLGSKLHMLFYPTAASLVIFLLEDYKKRYFVELCRRLRDGDTFYEAMDRVYDIKDAQGLNERLLAFLRNKTYEDIATDESLSVEW